MKITPSSSSLSSLSCWVCYLFWLMFYKLCLQTLRLRRCNQNLLESECNEWQANLSHSTYRCLEKSHDLWLRTTWNSRKIISIHLHITWFWCYNKPWHGVTHPHPCPHFRGGPRTFGIDFKKQELTKHQIKRRPWFKGRPKI